MKELPDLFREDGHVLVGAGNNAKTLCPFHEEKTPSCSLFNTDKGWRFHCFGCGASGNDIEYLHKYRGMAIKDALNFRDGKGDNTYTPVANPQKKAQKDSTSYERIGKLPSNFIYRHKYYWPNKKLAFVVQRYEIEGKKTFGYYTPNGDGTWLKGLAIKNNRPLYMLQDVLESEQHRPVMVVEGEKCADLVKANFTKTIVSCWAGGTESHSRSDFTPLHGRTVMLVADSNPQGYLCMAEIAKRLSPHCKNITLVLPTLTWDPDEENDIGDLIEREVKSVTEFIKKNNYQWNDETAQRMSKLAETFRKKAEKSKNQMMAASRLKTSIGELANDQKMVDSRHLVMSLNHQMEFWSGAMGKGIKLDSIAKAIEKAKDV